MKNQSFQMAKEQENCRKLDVALRRFTNDKLTEEQRSLIRSVLGWRSQHSIQVFRTAEEFRRAAKAGPADARVRMLFGGLETGMDTPAAALVCAADPRKLSNAIYIYLPIETEEERDDP